MTETTMTETTMTIAEFKTLVEVGEWTHESTIQDYDKIWIDEVVADGARETLRVHGGATVESKCGEITVYYHEGYSYTPELAGSLDRSQDGLDEPWIITGVTLVGEEGEEISINAVIDILPSKFSSPDYSSLKTKSVTRLDIEAGLEIVELSVDYDLDLAFCGELVASASSSHESAHPDYSGEVGRWEKLKIYKTIRNNLVCHRETLSLWVGERTISSTKVCTTIDEARKFFGDGALAQELYASYLDIK